MKFTFKSSIYAALLLILAAGGYWGYQTYAHYKLKQELVTAIISAHHVHVGIVAYRRDQQRPGTAPQENHSVTLEELASKGYVTPEDVQSLTSIPEFHFFPLSVDAPGDSILMEYRSYGGRVIFHLNGRAGFIND